MLINILLQVLIYYFKQFSGFGRSRSRLHHVRRGDSQPALFQPLVPHVLRHARKHRVVVASGRVHRSSRVPGWFGRQAVQDESRPRSLHKWAFCWLSLNIISNNRNSSAWYPLIFYLYLVKVTLFSELYLDKLFCCVLYRDI